MHGGVAAILARYRKAYPTREAMGTLSFLIIAVRMLAPDVALVTGEYHLARSAAGGGDAAGHYTLNCGRLQPVGRSSTTTPAASYN